MTNEEEIRTDDHIAEPVTNCHDLMDDTISKRAAIDEINEWIKAFLEQGHKESAADVRLIKDGIIQLPSAQPERTKRIIGKSRDGITMWYQCESCNEPVDEKDLFCSGCGRKFEDE